MMTLKVRLLDLHSKYGCITGLVRSGDRLSYQGSREIGKYFADTENIIVRGTGGNSVVTMTIDGFTLVIHLDEFKNFHLHISEEKFIKRVRFYESFMKIVDEHDETLKRLADS